jgi:multidrug transporter EmrE-like cation transporter
MTMIKYLMDMVYFVSVGKAFEKGGLSVIYPLARGTPPALIALGGVLLLGERLTFSRSIQEH